MDICCISGQDVPPCMELSQWTDILWEFRPDVPEKVFNVIITCTVFIETMRTPNAIEPMSSNSSFKLFP